MEIISNEIQPSDSTSEIIEQVKDCVSQGMSASEALSIIKIVTQSLLSVEECAASLDITRVILSKKIEDMVRHENIEYRAEVNEKSKLLKTTNVLSNRYVPIPRVEQEKRSEITNKPNWLAERKCRIRWYFYDPRRHTNVKSKIAKHVSTTRTGKYTLSCFTKNAPDSLSTVALSHESRLCEYRKLIDHTHDVRNIFKQMRKMEEMGFAIDMDEVDTFK